MKTSIKEKNFLIEEYINKRKSTQQIADSLNCNQITIWRKLKLYNILIRSSFETNIKYDKILTKEFLENEYLKNKKSLREIAKKVMCGANTIKIYMNKFNIKTRCLSESNKWLDGVYTNYLGYVLIHSPNHPRCNSQKYVYEHRLIMEAHLGRYLTEKEVVHHENEIRNDNRIENLKLFANQKEHTKYHKKFPKFNQLLNLMKQRRSIRKFIDKEIDKKILNDLIEGAIQAPSGSNTQAWRFIIITDKDDIDFLGKTKIPIVANSKAIIILLTDSTSCPYLNSSRANIFKHLPQKDIGIVMGYICLLAESLHIHQCIYQLSEEWPKSPMIRQRFHINKKYILQGIIGLGYSDEKIDCTTAKHAGKLIARKHVGYYLLDRKK